MKLHQRGVDLLLNLMDAEQHFDEVKPEELRQLIGEAIAVFGQIVARDVPRENDHDHEDGPAPAS
ncbi:MAG: hypothetical protein ABS35_37705 [Kaistia sp. SCN 65-12]|nr:MAG: hypothetical protein ABS35_37705 [Kaistia sp. SCN 65-12]